jgi:hypothetical protein
VGPEKAIDLRSREKRDFSTEACASFWRLQSHARATLFVEGHDEETSVYMAISPFWQTEGEHRVAKMAISGRVIADKRANAHSIDFMQYALTR